MNIIRPLLLLIAVAITLFAFKDRLLDNEEIIPCEEIKLKCLVLGREISGEHIVKNDTEYQKLILERSPHSSCGNYQLPAIDFNQYTLIGYISSIAGCNFPELTHEIKKTNNNYFVNINITQIGLCERNNPITFWCLIPKINDSSLVEFEINKN